MSAAAQTSDSLPARLRERTNGYTVTPAQYAQAALVALVALTAIVATGAAVRLTGSGLGCPTWPKCYGNVYPPLNTHAVIEFANRVVTVPVSIAAGAAWLLALRRRPYRRDLAWIGGLLPLGVVGQAVLGGFTVKGALDYGWVMGHFALSMLILLAAAVLLWRARRGAALEGGRGVALEGGQGAARDARQGAARDARGAAREAGQGAVESATATGDADEAWLTKPLWALTALGALTIFAGTAATAAGPHAGGSPGQRINRLDFDGRGTMDFVIHRHGEIALVFSLAAVALWWLARRRGVAPRVQRPLTVLCGLLALQGVVGLDQYETHLPTELVWVHVCLACGAWLATLWAACAAGALLPERTPASRERRQGAAVRGSAPVDLPGN